MRWPTAILPSFSATAGRGLRLAVCGLIAAAQLLLFSHAAMVGHRTCALHGESVHVRPSRPSGDSWRAEPTAAPASSEAGHHEHEHCVSLGQSRERLLLSAKTELPFGGLVTGHHHPVLAEQHPVAVALWSLAPKNSPPA